MAYSKTTWTDGTTSVDASNMNKIENELSIADDGITFENRRDEIIFADGITMNSYSIFRCSSTLAVMNLRVVIAAGTYTDALFTLPVSSTTRIYFCTELLDSNNVATMRACWLSTNGAVTFFSSSITISSSTNAFFRLVFPIA